MQGVCQCSDGWNGRSDWFNRESRDCQINDLAVRILWSIQLLFICSVGIPGWVRMIKYLKSLKQKRQEQRAHGRVPSLTKNKALIAMVCYWFGCWPCHVALCAWKVSMPEQKIGVDIMPSLWWFLERSFFYLVGYFFQPALMRSLMKGKHDADKYLAKRRVVLAWKVICASMILVGGLVFVPVIDPSGILPQATLVTFNSVMFITLVSLGSYAQSVRFHVSEILDKSYEISKDERVLDIRDSQVAIQNEVTRQTFAQMLLYLGFGAFPFLWSKHDYLYPISITVMPIVGFRGLKLLVEGTEGSSSRRSQRKRKGTGASGHDDTERTRKQTLEVTTTMEPFAGDELLDPAQDHA
jgi:hypothetical protein